MTAERGGAAHARQGSIDRALDLTNWDNFTGLSGRGSGLHSRRRVVQAICVGNGDDAGLSRARRVIDGDRFPPRDGIACANRKDGNWFDMSARAPSRET